MRPWKKGRLGVDIPCSAFPFFFVNSNPKNSHGLIELQCSHDIIVICLATSKGSHSNNVNRRGSFSIRGRGQSCWAFSFAVNKFAIYHTEVSGALFGFYGEGGVWSSLSSCARGLALRSHGETERGDRVELE